MAFRRWLLLLCLVVAVLDLLTVCNANPAYGNGIESEVLFAPTQDGGTRISGLRNRADKDFVLGGLLGITFDDGGVGCGDTFNEVAFQVLEGLLLVLDLLNNDTDVLPGLTLGYDIRDTCFSENVGLDEALDLIVTGTDLDIEGCRGRTVIAGGNSTVPPLIGIVGATTSRVSVPVAGLGRLLQVPMISYSATSPDLSSRDIYPYFFRTIPPDNFQARAMVDLMLEFDWTHISVLYSGNSYGRGGVAEIRELAAIHGICIDLDRAIDDEGTDEDYDRLVEELIESDAYVVVLFALRPHAEAVLSRVFNSNEPLRFTWIASDGWVRSTRLVQMFTETTAGHYAFGPFTNTVEEFDRYYSQLTVRNNKRNPWMEDFFAEIAGCEEEPDKCNNESLDTNLTDVIPSYEQDPQTSLGIDAVLAFGQALHNFLLDNCDEPVQWNRETQSCSGQKKELNGENMLQYIQSVEVERLTGTTVQFDEQGNADGKYEIVNYQAIDNNGIREYIFVRVGIWDGLATETVQLDNSMTLQYGVDSSGNVVLERPSFQCTQCGVGSYRRTTLSCCGLCDPCLGRNYSGTPSATSCDRCSEDMWGNKPLEGSDGCVKIDEVSSDFGDPWAIVIVIIAIFGLIAVAFTAVVIGIYWKTPVVVSSGREQMILILIGITLSFLLAFFYVAPPSTGICFFQRVGVWISFSLIFGALLIKSIRVARIFLNKTSLTRVRFTEPYYQVLFTFLIVFVQIVLIIVSLAVKPPETDRETRRDEDDSNDFPKIIVSCAPDPLAILILSAAYETGLIIICTILGSMSFRYPANFKEAKHITFCTFALLIIWLTFIPTYFAIQSMQEFQSAVIAMAVMLSAFAVLACFFGPKLYIVLFRPARNSKDYSSTRHQHKIPTNDGELSLSAPVIHLKRLSGANITSNREDEPNAPHHNINTQSKAQGGAPSCDTETENGGVPVPELAEKSVQASTAM